MTKHIHTFKTMIFLVNMGLDRGTRLNMQLWN